MNNLFVLASLILCIGASQIQAQSTSKTKDLFAKSQKTWTKIKQECGNTYAYTLQRAFLPSARVEELIVAVVDGKVVGTRLVEYNGKEEISSKVDLATSFHDQPIGTLDDIYKKGEEILSPKFKAKSVFFDVDKNNLPKSLGWYPKGEELVDRQASGYSFKSIEWKKKEKEMSELEQLKSSKASWETAKKACNNTYSYSLKKAFYMGNDWKELTVFVVDGKVNKTSLVDFKNGKAGRADTEKQPIFGDLPVGTLDDIYAKAEEVLTAPKTKIEKVYFSLGNGNLIGGVAWQGANMARIMDKPLPGYNVFNIECKK